MNSQTAKPSKPAKPSNATPSSSSRSSSSSVSSHLAMVELKQRILTSLSKLADRDTHQIGKEDLEKIIQSLSPETLPMLLNCLYDSCCDPKPAVKKESLRLLSFVCHTHRDLSSTHLTKIIAHIVKRLRDADSGVRDACRDAIGALSGQYLKGKEEGNASGVGSLVGLFAKPLFEAMAEQNKGFQSGAAICMAKMVESATDLPLAAFQKLCPRICKLLNNPNYLAKASLFPVVASLSQVGAIAPQSMEPLLQSIHECLGSTDWATRKGAADTLISLALNSSSLITDKADSTLTVLEACRFDKIKPVRDSMAEALNLWKKIAGKGEDGAPDNLTTSSSEQSKSEKNGEINPCSGERTEMLAKDSCNGSSNNSDSASKDKAGSIPGKAVLILKKKVPALTDKELNPEFFQKLEKRGSDDLPVEVVLPRTCKSSLNTKNENESESNYSDSRIRSNCLDRTAVLHTKQRYFGDFARDKWSVERMIGEELRKRAFDDDQNEINQTETSGHHAAFSKTDTHYEASMNDKGNWSALQRQLLHMERQQAHLMKMLQDFMGGSHDSMITLENRVRGLERVVEQMARDLSMPSGKRGNYAMGSEDSNRPLGKYDGFPDYSSATYNRRFQFGDRFTQSDGITSGMRERGPTWRTEIDDWDFPQYGVSRNGQIGTRRARGSGQTDSRSNKSENETEHAGNSRRAWDKCGGPIRLGEGPSARSIWQASKDEATLEAIRVAGEDSGTSQAGRVAIPEAEAMEDDNNGGRERDPIWTSWSNAMLALQVGDTDSAYAEVLSTGDDHLLVKLMDKTGPVVDQLSSGIGKEALHAIGEFLLDHNLIDICLSWIQQLLEVVLENGPDVLGISMELKKEILFNLHEAYSTIDPPEEWEGATPDQLLVQLASAWGIEIQLFDK